MSTLNYFQRYPTTRIFKFPFRHVIALRTYFLSSINSSLNGRQRSKEGKKEIYKSGYFGNEKCSLDEIKNIFHIF